EAPAWQEGEYTDRGKWMDGWETRRRRDVLPGDPGLDRAHDWCIVHLGAFGVVRGVDVETTHLRGNFPESCALDVCTMAGAAAADARARLDHRPTRRARHHQARRSGFAAFQRERAWRLQPGGLRASGASERPGVGSGRRA